MLLHCFASPISNTAAPLTATHEHDSWPPPFNGSLLPPRIASATLAFAAPRIEDMRDVYNVVAFAAMMHAR
jgi:hypothetical protein